MKATITLLTDFGREDHYVAVMKSVILGICPQAGVIDVTHDIAPHDIRAAAVIVAEVCRWCPAGTVHVVVVDPGVGSRRGILAGRWDTQIIVAPDNGLVSLVQAREPAAELRQVTNERLFMPQVSNTFHGRDIMAPVAARLAAGMPLAEVGPRLEGPQTLPGLEPSRRGSEIVGQVLFVDHFGNLITNIPASAVTAAASLRVRVADRDIAGLARSYSEVAAGALLAVVGSLGTVEIAVNQGDAAATLGVGAGSPVVCEL